MPFFSILIPSYNRPEYISGLLDSIFESNFDDFGIHYMIGQCYNFNGQFLESTNSLKKSEEIMNEGASIETKRPIYLCLLYTSPSPRDS